MSLLPLSGWMPRFSSWSAVAVLVALLGGLSSAQMIASDPGPPTWSRLCASNVVVPQSRAFWCGVDQGVVLERVDVEVEINDQTAVTTLWVTLRNPTPLRQEAELVIPVPKSAVVREFDFQGNSAEPRVELLAAVDAQKSYSEIVKQLRDPALLEFVGHSMVRSSVFPVEPGGQQKLRLRWEQLLVADGARVDYILPRSEMLNASVPGSITVSLNDAATIATVYSPTHDVAVHRVSAAKVKLSAGTQAPLQAGSFALSYLRGTEGVSASLLAYPDPKTGGGYFLLLAGLPVDTLRPRHNTVKREVTLVLDKSGSMRGSKMAQAKAAAIQVLEGLEEGESFNIVSYSDSVESLSPIAWVKTAETLAQARSYLAGITADGGTNLHDALLSSLTAGPTAGTLPIVLFLTDGLPTVGEVSEVAIRQMATQNNAHKKRIFTFGVGGDVNTPLLERLASASRGAPTFVFPNEDVEVKVSQVFKRLRGPVLAEPSLRVVTEINPSPRVKDLLPNQLPDLFVDDQLVVLGQYVGTEPLHFRLQGSFFGEPRAFEFEFELDKASTRNGIVPRLWASRKIGVLVDAVRQLGADQYTVAQQSVLAKDPRVKELVSEIVRLSTEFGILTEYTAFLAHEGTDLAAMDLNREQANGNLMSRGVGCRTGWAAVNQSANSIALSQQNRLNRDNSYLDENLLRVQVQSVLQMGDKTFYRRGSRWIESGVIESKDPVREIEFGSKEFDELLVQLLKQGRQGCVALAGEIILEVNGETVLVLPAGASTSQERANSEVEAAPQASPTPTLPTPISPTAPATPVGVDDGC